MLNFCGRKGQVTMYFSFFAAAVIIVTIAAVLAPLGVRFNSEMYLEGQRILNDSLPIINQISDDTIRTEVTEAVTDARDQGGNIIQVNAAIFQYSWVLMIFVLGLIIFLTARRLVEFGGGGFI